MNPMPPSVRKLALTAHVTSSIGWLGAVVGFLVLAVAGYASGSDATVRGTAIAMDLLGWFALVPLALASLITGILQSLGTAWGVWRHYWVVIKLFITVPATALLLLHMQPISTVAHLAADSTLSAGDHLEVRFQFVIQAAGALAVLLVATVLSIYKPKGLTSHGRRRQVERPAPVS
jgi:hypothetical protein